MKKVRFQGAEVTGSTRLAAFAHLARRLAESITSVDDAIAAVAATAAEFVGDVSGVLLLDPEQGNFVVAAAHEPDHRDGVSKFLGTRVSGKRSISADVIRTQQPFRWHRGQLEDRVANDGRIRIENGDIVDALLSVPLLVRGQVIGTVNVVRRPPGASYTEEDEVFLQELASLGALAIDNARLLAARDQAEADLELIATQLRTLFDNAGPLVVTNADDDKIVLVNPAAESLFAMTSDELTALTLSELAGAAVARPGAPVPYQRRDGATIHIEYRAQVRSTPLQPHLFIDRTHRMASEQEQRELLGRLAVTEDTVRRQLARDLHDELGQLLTAAALFAKRADALDTSGDKAILELRRTLALALSSLRRLAWSVRPAELESAPLSEALRDMAAGIGPVEIVTASAEVLDAVAPDIAGAIYRVTQEAVTNAIRHADATSIRVTSTVDDEDIVVRITDDGRGFDVAAVPWGHLGLRVMRERAAVMRGGLAVTSAPGQGTAVELRVPLSAAAPVAS